MSVTEWVFVIVEVSLSDLHFLELRQALESSRGLQHGEVVVVESPGMITESGHGKKHH